MLTATLALGIFLLVMAPVVLLVHPKHLGPGLPVNVVNQQSQDAKTGLYVLAFVIMLPLALVFVPRLADAIAAGPNRDVLPVLAGGLAAALAATIILLRVSSRLPWGDGLGAVLAGAFLWCAASTWVLLRTLRGGAWPGLLRASRSSRGVWLVSAALGLGTVLCVTNLKSLTVAPMVIGGVVALGVLAGYRPAGATGRAPPRAPRPTGLLVDVVAIVLLLVAIPDVVIFHTSRAIPNTLFEPGIMQFQQDWILGPTNQLLGGGALLVNAPVSQYGVGLVYFLAGWFHLAPIGYGTFGLLDGILTALFYAGGYAVLRLARVPRLLAIAALAIGVITMIYNLRFTVGELPEQGPLRFGMPMALIVMTLVAARWPARARVARVAGLLVVAISSLWALEAFAYTAFTFAAITAVEGALHTRAARRRFVLTQIALALGACVVAHLAFAIVTLAGSGQLPHWNYYFAYLRALLLGGVEGSITYGFDNWSPGLALGAVDLVSAAAVVLLLLRAPALARRERLTVIALGATTAYSIAAFSYVDNRSATYLLLYVGLPALLVVVLWLRLLLSTSERVPASLRTGALALCLFVAVLLISAAWPTVGSRFSRSALGHAYPGGGLTAALHRLWHPPPIDPRAPEGARLLARYIPGSRALVLLPTAEGQDLSVELLMRSKRPNRLFIGFGDMDTFVPEVWKPIISRQLRELRAGDRLLIDKNAQKITATLRANPSLDPVTHPLEGGAGQVEWILRQIDQRFRMQPIYRDGVGFVVAQLVPR